MLNNGKSSVVHIEKPKVYLTSFLWNWISCKYFHLHIPVTFTKRANLKKKTILLLCFSHAVSVESELAKRANGNLETFQQCNIDIFKRSKFWSPPPAMSRMSILSQRVLQQRWIAVDQLMIFLTFSYQSILLSNKYIVTVDLYK